MFNDEVVRRQNYDVLFIVTVMVMTKLYNFIIALSDRCWQFSFSVQPNTSHRIDSNDFCVHDSQSELLLEHNV